MDVPSTVETALEGVEVDGRTCLEAGAGAGNATAGLLEAGAETVLAVTNDREHAATVRERIAEEHPGRVATIEADLRATPLPPASVEVLTAHALYNVVPVEDLDRIAAELTRVAEPGASLVVDDYAPLPADASMRELFAVENAATELAEGRPALTFYPAEHLRGVFEAHGWTCQRRTTLLDPVPWTADHVEAHAAAAKDAADSLSGDLGDALANEADRLGDAIGSESAGEMYSLAFQLPA